MIETPGLSDSLKIVKQTKPADNPYLKEISEQATQDPTENMEMFRVYVARLNRLIQNNMPFLLTAFNITELAISIVLSNSFLPKKLKEACFNMPGSSTTVIVQYTMMSDEGTRDLIKIRKFPSVRAFIDATRSLDDLLQKMKEFVKERKAQVEEEVLDKDDGDGLLHPPV